MEIMKIIKLRKNRRLFTWASELSAFMMENYLFNNFWNKKRRPNGRPFLKYVSEQPSARPGCRLSELTVSDVHGDFEAETQIGSSGGSPVHSHLLMLMCLGCRRAGFGLTK